MTIYRGFSTLLSNEYFKVGDFDLAKRDLINHFSIRKGEKLMNPNFGSVIWSMIFEPLNETSKQVIVDDIKRIVNYDPRISVEHINIIEHTHGIMVELELIYLPGGQRAFIQLPFLHE